MKHRIITKLVSKVLIISGLLINQSFAMSFFSKKDELPTPPISIPIDISKKGNKAEIDLRIQAKAEKKELEPESTAFELKFVHYDPRQDKNSKYYISSFRQNLIMIGALRKYFEPKYTKEEKNEIWKDNERLTKLLGGGFTVDDGSQYGKHFDYPAVPFPNIRLTINDINDPNKKVIYNEVLEVKKHWQIAGYFYKYLETINLKPGNYKILLEVNSDAPEFKGTDVKIIIGSYFLK